MIMRAVLEEKSPSLLEAHGGAAKVCVSTGAKLMTRMNMSYRAKTSSRIIPPADQVATARDEFFAQVAGCFPGYEIDRHLVLNFDQTFQAFNPHRGHTWDKRGADRVQLKSDKDGFTLCPVVSAAGIVSAQMIFGGTSKLVFPRIPPGPFLRYNHTANHWPNESTTLELWNSIILPHIASRRAVLGQSAAPAIVLADAFAAHWTHDVKNLVSRQEAIAYIAVPDCLTHLFQPLDLGIIAAIKQSVLRRKDEFMQREVQTAVRENRGVVLSKSRIVLRDQVTMYIKECLGDPNICAERCCLSGFERAGIIRLLYGRGERAPDVDAAVPPPLCDECGEYAAPQEHTPRCVCFSEDQDTNLCGGCFFNHSNLCEQRHDV